MLEGGHYTGDGVDGKALGARVVHRLLDGLQELVAILHGQARVGVGDAQSLVGLVHVDEDHLAAVDKGLVEELEGLEVMGGLVGGLRGQEEHSRLAFGGAAAKDLHAGAGLSSTCCSRQEDAVPQGYPSPKDLVQVVYASQQTFRTSWSRTAASLRFFRHD